MSIDLEPRLLRQVEMILREHVPECEVWVFGSRVGSSHPKRFSDLDLAVIATDALPTRRLALLVYAFAESDLPMKVDVVDWRSTTPAMRERIAAQHETLLRPSQPMTPDTTLSASKSRA
jgi:type I restriction enzyme S subunit